MLQDISNLTARHKKVIDLTKYKTEMCRNWTETSSCHYGIKCNFAHGHHELVGKPQANSKYKSKRCLPFHNLGYCTYGHRCLFLHKDEDDEKPIDYQRVKELLGKSRLRVFEQIAPSDDQYTVKFEEYLKEIQAGRLKLDWTPDDTVKHN